MRTRHECSNKFLSETLTGLFPNENKRKLEGFYRKLEMSHSYFSVILIIIKRSDCSTDVFFSIINLLGFIMTIPNIDVKTQENTQNPTW